MKLKYRYDITTGAMVHIGPNPFYMQIRQEVHNVHEIHLKAKREKIRELFIQDFLQQQKELRGINFDYIQLLYSSYEVFLNKISISKTFNNFCGF